MMGNGPKKISDRYFLFTLSILLGGWEFLGHQDFFPVHLVPPPARIAWTIWENREEFARAFYETSSRVLGGLSLSILLGLMIAVGAYWSRWIRSFLLPISIFFQTVPIIAIAPLLVIYLGFGNPTVLASCSIVSIFPVIASTLMGLDQTPPGWRDLFQVIGAKPWQTFWFLQLPAAYVHIMTGIKVAIGLAIIGTVAGEFVGGGGLGALIDSARTQQRIDIVFACLVLLSSQGLILLSLQNFLNRFILKIRPYTLSLEVL